MVEKQFWGWDKNYPNGEMCQSDPCDVVGGWAIFDTYRETVNEDGSTACSVRFLNQAGWNRYAQLKMLFGLADS